VGFVDDLQLSPSSHRLRQCTFEWWLGCDGPQASEDLGGYARVSQACDEPPPATMRSRHQWRLRGRADRTAGTGYWLRMHPAFARGSADRRGKIVALSNFCRACKLNHHRLLSADELGHSPDTFGLASPRYVDVPPPSHPLDPRRLTTITSAALDAA
jgi:hypothetical protein